MKIAISGSSGFIGSHLSVYFRRRGDVVVPLRRALFQSAEALANALKGVDAVINLAGASIGGRWNEEYKRLLLESRVNTTRKLVYAINGMADKPEIFISVSAVGIYPDGKIYTEQDVIPDHLSDFLFTICKQWEEEARQVSSDVRLVVPRLGVVLAADGGALPSMLLPFRLFMGGKIGNGQQGLSWIHINDLLRAFDFVIRKKQLLGIFNFVAPDPVNNKTFTSVASGILHRPDWFVVPPCLFRLILGEGATVVLSGQQAYPERLLHAGFVFDYSNIRLALRNIIRHSKEEEAAPA